jgi:hypothetical protein
MRRRSFKFAAAIIILAIASLFASDLVVDWKIEQARARCKENRSRSTTEALASAESLYEGLPDEVFVFHQAAETILHRRFQFVEFERRLIPPQKGRSNSDRFYNQFFEDRLGDETGEKYVRVSVASAGDPRCAPFKYHVTMYPNLVANEYRWWGLPPDKCLAVERTNELRAVAERVYVPEHSRKRGKRGEWGGWITYRERLSKVILGRVWVGGYTHSRRRYFECVTDVQLRSLDKSMASQANLDLLPPLPITESNHASFPSRRVGSIPSMDHEAPVQTESGSKQRKAFAYENWELPGQTLDNGHTFYQPFYERTESGISLAGYRLHIVRPDRRHVVRISDGERSFTHCGFLTRRQSLLFITCNAWKAPHDAKWVRGNWLLLYEDGGIPKEIIELELAGSPLSGSSFLSVVEIKAFDADSLKAKVHFSRKEANEMVPYEIEVTFRLAPTTG